MSNNPQLLYVAGPNGAGKSTFSKELSKLVPLSLMWTKLLPA